jgi:hypothetical protein
VVSVAIDFTTGSGGKKPGKWHKHSSLGWIPRIGLVGTLLVCFILLFSQTFAANTSLNSGANVEFGQGQQQTTNCTSNDYLTVTPQSGYLNGANSTTFTLTSFTLTHIPYTCWNKSFIFQAYDSSGALLEIDSTSNSISGTYLGADSFGSGSITGTSGEQTPGVYGSLTISINSPVALTTNVYKVVVQSSVNGENDLVLNWNFANPTDLGRSSIGTFNLLPVGNPTQVSGIGAGKALHLDGSSYLYNDNQIPHSLLGNARYTVTAWFKTDQQSRGNAGIIGWGQNAGCLSNNLRFEGFNQFRVYWYSCDVVGRSDLAFNDGVWHMVATTYDGTSQNIYLDGLLLETGPRPGGPNFQQGRFVLGATTADTSFIGDLANVSVYKKALTGPTINAMYNALHH